MRYVVEFVEVCLSLHESRFKDRNCILKTCREKQRSMSCGSAFNLEGNRQRAKPACSVLSDVTSRDRMFGLASPSADVSLLAVRFSLEITEVTLPDFNVIKVSSVSVSHLG